MFLGDARDYDLNPACAVLSFFPINFIGYAAGFFVPKKIPASITVPCSGTAKVVSRPSPASSTAKSAVLLVTFRNIGT